MRYCKQVYGMLVGRSENAEKELKDRRQVNKKRIMPPSPLNRLFDLIYS